MMYYGIILFMMRKSKKIADKDKSMENEDPFAKVDKLVFAIYISSFLFYNIIYFFKFIDKMIWIISTFEFGDAKIKLVQMWFFFILNFFFGWWQSLHTYGNTIHIKLTDKNFAKTWTTSTLSSAIPNEFPRSSDADRYSGKFVGNTINFWYSKQLCSSTLKIHLHHNWLFWNSFVSKFSRHNSVSNIRQSAGTKRIWETVICQNSGNIILWSLL